MKEGLLILSINSLNLKIFTSTATLGGNELHQIRTLGKFIEFHPMRFLNTTLTLDDFGRDLSDFHLCVAGAHS